MASIRKTKTASGATAVQIIRYENRKVVLMKHVGSGHTPEEVAALVESGRVCLEQMTLQPSLFLKSERRTLPLATSQYIGVTHQFAYECLLEITKRCGFTTHSDRALVDFALMRLIEPASKLRSIELLKRYFKIVYARRSLHRALPHMQKRKAAMEQIAVACAKGVLHSDLELVLYDVTTLYFETFAADDLRIQGFSKDNKSQQPQIVIGLLVTRAGFPLGYEVFPGNTFEGNTMIPVLESFAKEHHVTTPTVVADAGMLSQTNISTLKKNGLSYIVGGRLANCSLKMITQIAEALHCSDGATVRFSTPQGDLVASFSAKRFRKNTAEMNVQIEKGKKLIVKKEPGKRAKFVKRANQETYELNTALIEKTKLLLGVKGYYTNIPEKQLSNQAIINRYHDLWHVEQAFRMAKSDIATRPIFHYQAVAVRAHILICFVALVIGKYLEIHVGLSIKKIIDILWSVTDATLMDTSTKETFMLRSPLNTDAQNLLKKLHMSY
ncbi:MAG: IS1634 family transposase [Nitrospirota bacterium]